jgi:hypothetical protein
MPGGVVEVDHIDRVYPNLLERHMIVGQRMPYARHEIARVPTVGSHPPDLLHDLRRKGHGLPFLKDLQVFVAHHVKQHGIERLIAGRLMRGKPARPDEHVVRVRKVAVILAVVEEQIDPDRRRSCLERIRDTKQHGNAGGAIVGARDRHTLLRQVCTPIGSGSGVPVGQEQHPLGRLRLEAREEVLQMQHFTAAQLVGDVLHDHGIGALAKLSQEPVGFLLMPRLVGNPWTEGHLLLDVCEGGLAVELDGTLATAAAPRARLTPEQKEQSQAPGLSPQAPRHRICPTLVESWTNAVITNCEILRFVCRSSLRTYAI